MTPEEKIADINRRRLTAVHACREILDRCTAARRNMTAEEAQAYDRADAEIDGCDRDRDRLLADDSRQREREGIEEEWRRITTPREYDDARSRERTELEGFFRRGGAVTSIDVNLSRAANAVEAYRDGARGQELRLIAGDTGASGGSLTVPTVIASEIYETLTASVAMRRTRATIITRPNGDPFVIPKVATHGIATQIASQNTALAGTDPIFGSTTLTFYDSGQLVPIVNNIVEDASVDMLAFVANNIGRAIGEHTAQWYVTGTGSGQPQGVMTAIGGAGTITTGGSLIDPSVEKFIDLEFSVNNSYRVNAEWLMRDATAATVRKLRDGVGGTIGAYLWQPSPTVGLAGGQPDTFLGYPVHTDPNVASLASNAKVAAFGDFSAYYLADAVGLRVERSDDLLFNVDQVAFRGKLRTSGAVVDSSAFNVMVRNV